MPRKALEAPPVQQAPNAKIQGGAESGNQAKDAGLIPIPAPVFLTTDQLSKKPAAIHVPALETPETRSVIVSGTMILGLRIDERGQVLDVEVMQNELPEVCLAAAVNAFKQARFTAGEQNGQRVNTFMRIEVRYDDRRLKGE